VKNLESGQPPLERRFIPKVLEPESKLE